MTIYTILDISTQAVVWTGEAANAGDALDRFEATGAQFTTWTHELHNDGTAELHLPETEASA